MLASGIAKKPLSATEHNFSSWSFVVVKGGKAKKTKKTLYLLLLFYRCQIICKGEKGRNYLVLVGNGLQAGLVLL